VPKEGLASETHTPPPASGTVLIVEDNDSTRVRMSNLLRADGYEVIEAVDGLDALRKVSARQFDAILLDLVLPNVDGWQFRATQLRHPELASIPTVIVTVQPLREPDRYALRTVDIVQKPFEDAELLQAVRRACGVHAPDAASPRWNAERWVAIPASTGQRRIVYRCQHCPGDGSPIDRSRRATGPQGS